MVIKTLKTSNTRKNFKNSASRKRTEINFQRRFEQICFSTPLSEKYSGLREFAVQGYGIADLIILRSNNKADKSEIHAFELKISDWKKALQQAYRYSYYADKAFVVIPIDQINAPLDNLELFRSMNIGLWAVDVTQKKIHKKFTPVKSKPLNSEAKQKALRLITISNQSQQGL